MEATPEPVKLLISYDPIPELQEPYFRYVLGEFVPSLARAGLPMCEAWHTAFGAYPRRVAGFYARDRAALESVLASESFHDLESRLQRYVVNYRKRVVRFRRNFQI